MTVKFYVLQKHTVTGKTRNKFLFAKEKSILMTGTPVTNAGQTYEVNSQEWINKRAGVLKALCLEVPKI
jgi:hypothetical protein